MFSKEYCSAALLAFSLTLLLPLAAAAQPADDAVFGEQVDVRVINLEVVVTDRSGAYVPGLGVEDFELLVDGQPVAIDYFSEIRDRRAVAPPAGESAGTAPVPAVTPGETVGTSYLLFVDNYFGVERDRDRVLKRMRDDLAGFPRTDQMAIVAFDGRRLELVANWTRSPADLAAAFDRAMEMPALGLQRQGELTRFEAQLGFLSSGLIDETTNNLYEEYVRTLSTQVKSALSAATTALRTFAQPEGRKVMLLTSGGWPRDPQIFALGDALDGRTQFTSLYSPKEAFDNLTDTANLLGYTLYPVDMPGLRSAAGGAGERLTERVSGADSVGAGSVALNRQSRAAGRENESEATLITLARDSGGRALLNGQRDVAFEEVREDLGSYYWLGFSPRRARDDRQHSVEVRVARPGLEVRSRTGFRDLSRRREVTMRVESELLFANDLGLTGDQLAVEVGRPKRGRGKGVKLPVTLRVPLDKVVMLPVRGGFEARLELRAAAIEEDGERSEIPVVPVRLAGPTRPLPGQYASYETVLQVRAKKQRLVLALYDLAGEGLLTSQVEIDP